MSIVGMWSSIVFHSNEPENEVLAFLPDGSGVYEYYWWRLSFYATFRYTFDGVTLHCTGIYDYDYDFETEMQRETAAQWSFSTKVSFGEHQHEFDHHTFDVLELAHALPMTEQRRFGRTIAAEAMNEYRLPSFWEEPNNDDSGTRE